MDAPLWVLCGAAVGMLLALAHWVAASSGAVAMLPSMPLWAFALMVAGGLWLCLWITRLRLLGLVPLMVGAIEASFATAPDLLISGDGCHLAVVGEGGVPLLLRDRAGDYVRDLFAEASGFDGDPGAIVSEPHTSCSRDACVTQLRKGESQWQLLAIHSSTRIEWATLIRSWRRQISSSPSERCPAAVRLAGSSSTGAAWLAAAVSQFTWTSGRRWTWSPSGSPAIRGRRPSLGFAPRRELVPSRIDEVEAPPARKCEDRLGDDAARLRHGVERGVQVVDPHHR